MVDGLVPGLVVLGLGLAWLAALIAVTATPSEEKFRFEAVYNPIRRERRPGR